MSESLKKEPKVPLDLKNTQEWFGSVIKRRLVEGDHINPTAPNGKEISTDAAHYIVPSPTLRPHQRIEIYNQQYWWRLINTLQINTPLLLRLFGFTAFNETIAIPYLLKYPPNSWSLNTLGEKLPQWVQEEYHQPDHLLVYKAAYLDEIFASNFYALQYPHLDFTSLAQQDPDALLEMPFCLQPHVYPLEFEYDLLTFRDLLVKQEGDYWTKNPFPELKKDKAYYYILFRNFENNIAWKLIEKDEYLLLSQFKTGISIQAACDWIEDQEEDLRESLEGHLQKWLQDWTRYGWLILNPQN